MIGFEQAEPEYPGLALAEPAPPHSGTAGTKYYVPAVQKTRFKGKIFYVIILDTCEAIHEEAFQKFTAFLNEQMIVE